MWLSIGLAAIVVAQLLSLSQTRHLLLLDPQRRRFFAEYMWTEFDAPKRAALEISFTDSTR